MKRVLILTACLVLLVSTAATAATFSFSGNIVNHNDIVTINFSLLNNATNVSVWTDSFQDGANFDPITALWDSAGNLIAQNDDNPTVGPGQTYWDSGFFLPTLSAGNYFLTIASYSNFASGPHISNGFAYDGQTPIPIQNHWNGGAGYWHVILDGVDAASSVPEPSAFMLIGSGLAGLFFMKRRMQK